MKILIADDEDYTREGLIESVSWGKYDIDEIMQAVNGLEAIKIAKWFRPNIVLTDVRMPKMDGIKFATEVLEMNPGCRIIFMSGYMEIEYLKSAIRLAAIDYIEKPIDIDILCRALQKAVDEIKSSQRNIEAVQSSMEFQQQKLFSLITGKESEEKTLEKLAQESGFPLEQNYICMLLQMPVKESDSGRRMDMLKGIIQDASCKVVGNYNYEKRQYEFVMAYSEKDQYRLGPLYQKLLELLPQSRIGLGVEVWDYRNIYNSYRTAYIAINKAFYQEEQRLFEIDEGIMQKSFIEPGIYSEFIQILSEQPADLAVWFEKIFDLFYQNKYYQKEQIYMLMTSLLTAIYKQYPELYEVIPGIMQEDQISQYIRERDYLSEIRELIEKLLEQLQVNQKEQSGHSRIVRGVVDYIKLHYGEESLSMTQIAEYLHFSPAYLNVLFKQEMKVTLKQYLSNYRLERAKYMLEQDYGKITEIAVKCRYTNANYFAKVFREATGMSPAEYREQKGGSQWGRE